MSFGVTLALLGLAGLSASTSMAFPVVLLVAGLAWVALCWRGFRLVLTPSTLVVKRFGPTTTVPLDDITFVDTVAADPVIGASRKALRVTQRNGAVRRFPEISDASKNVESGLDHAVEVIRSALT
jgi:hypothetical protein